MIEEGQIFCGSVVDGVDAPKAFGPPHRDATQARIWAENPALSGLTGRETLVFLRVHSVHAVRIGAVRLEKIAAVPDTSQATAVADAAQPAGTADGAADVGDKS